MSEDKQVVKANSIMEGRLALAEQWRQDWIVNAEEGTTIQMVMAPAYWAHVSRKFQMMDRIEVRMETGEWIAELIVLAVGMNWAKVHLLQHYSFEAVNEDMPGSQQHIAYWRGMQHKWAVKRLSDKEVLQSGFANKEEANVWLRNHEAVNQAT